MGPIPRLSAAHRLPRWLFVRLILTPRAVAAAEALLATLPAGARARSNAHFEGNHRLLLWNLATAPGAVWLLLGTSGRARSLMAMRWKAAHEPAPAR